jgi:hypothetical protein
MWANALGTDCIVRIRLLPLNGTAPVRESVRGIAPLFSSRAVVSGVVVAAANFYSGRNRAVSVMNGIAFDAISRRLFVTGKFWPFLYDSVPEPLPEAYAHDELPLTRRRFGQLCPKHDMSLDDILFSTTLMQPATASANGLGAGAGTIEQSAESYGIFAGDNGGAGAAQNDGGGLGLGLGLSMGLMTADEAGDGEGGSADAVPAATMRLSTKHIRFRPRVGRAAAPSKAVKVPANSLQPMPHAHTDQTGAPAGKR